MRIKSVHVKNFRSILDAKLDCDNLTALVGRNGSGKSSLLRAIELFYDGSAKVAEDDFYAKDSTRPIEIEICYTALATEAKEKFAAYLENDELTIVRVFSLNEGKLSATYHGSRLLNPEFSEVRTAPKAAEKKPLYEALRQSGKYPDLPKWSNLDAVGDALKGWEAANQGACRRTRDDGQFFGFKEVAQGFLGRYTRFILIPAVRDAGADAREGRGSVITTLMDLVVRNSIARRQDLITLQAQTQQQYDQIVDPSNLTELQALAGRLSTTLGTYVPNSTVQLDWTPADPIAFPLPKADVKITEDGYSSSVERTGHGLQRAFVLTMLQHLGMTNDEPQAVAPAAGSAAPTGVSTQPVRQSVSLVLAIEEPELYQHPNRQRHFAAVLSKLSAGTIPGVADSTQIIYGTHSPLFVGLDQFDHVRILQKVPGEMGKPKVTRIIRTTLDVVAYKLWEATQKGGEPFTAESLKARLQPIMTPWMNEGFFADLVVLVEGEDDRAAIWGTALSLGIDLSSAGISVLPCGGKTCIDRPYLIFRQLGIPVYALWDSDSSNDDPKPEINRLLLRIVGATEEDWPVGVFDSHACFYRDLETTIRSEVGEVEYDRLSIDVADELGLGGIKRAKKNPTYVQQLVVRSKQIGKPSKSLLDIVEKIRRLCPTP